MKIYYCILVDAVGIYLSSVYMIYRLQQGLPFKLQNLDLQFVCRLITSLAFLSCQILLFPSIVNLILSTNTTTKGHFER